MTTMGMKQRQAYNYIAIAEKLPAQLIEQNAAAGVTKLALLAQLSGQEQQQITAETNLTETTVAELKVQIKELQAKNAGYAEQLSLLQNQPPVAEVQAEEVDMDALRAEIHAEMKAEMESQRLADAKMTELNEAFDTLMGAIRTGTPVNGRPAGADGSEPGTPARRHSPSVGRNSPSRALSVVLLPEPLGPSSP